MSKLCCVILAVLSRCCVPWTLPAAKAGSNCYHAQHASFSEAHLPHSVLQQSYVAYCRFTKSVIKSRAALTYAEAQTRIDDERLTDDVSAGLRELNRIAKILRQRRAERGALSLASPEVRFEIDTETHDPTDVGMYQVRSTSGRSAACRSNTAGRPLA